MKPLRKYPKKAAAPSTFLNPVPVVMVSCRGIAEGYDKDNIVTIAWAGTINSEPPMLSISVRKSRFSHEQIVQAQEFVVNLVHRDLLRACDFCGVKSGRDIDKFEFCHLTPEKAEGLEHARAIAESPVSISCKVRQTIELGSHDLFLAEIVGVSVAEELYDDVNKIRLNEADLIAYSHGEYVPLGNPVGFFGYSVAKPEILKKRLAAMKPEKSRNQDAGNKGRRK